VSLILDALKKLDREKDAHEPGVVVVGSVPWGRPQRSRSPIPLALVGAGLVALVAAGWWVLRPAPRPTTPALPPPGHGPAERSSQAPAAVLPPAATAGAEVAPPPRRPPLPGQRREPGPTAAPAPAPGADTPATTEAPDVAASAARTDPDDLRLQAIAVRDGRPIALINDRLVREGDRFGAVTVVRIGEAEVEIEVRGQRRVLRF
jgi:hypothetical protein